jgi:hypothetical protein
VSAPVFVFGSNLAGRHGKGAALWARQNRGAVYGQGHGIQGDSYAIPTKGYQLETLPLPLIAGFVAEFLEFARKYWMRQFQLTPIGCGLAGYKREQIEPLFAGAPDNVIWPPEWSEPAQGGVTRMGGNSERGSVAEGHSTRSASADAPTPSGQNTPTNTGEIR